jgi:hypothetical protein
VQEQYDWTSPETDATSIEALPSNWLFSTVRIEELLFPQGVQTLARPATRGIGTVTLREVVMTA